MSDYKALYRKWRPFDFDDVCGQDTVTDILKYEVEHNKLSHAYLFCGSRGTGKTSCAKILAKAVNCLSPKNGNPCNECEACRSIDAGIATDVIEMDAASNNGVNDVRTLKDEINFTPALLKYRVYIIDEVHMMSGAAFNALLKTLEEPPAYVIFILATTEYNKLPTTIVSRCQRFDFRRISSDVIIERLMKIADAEGIDLAPDGARLIARASRGGMRDAVSLLELCAGARTKIDASLVSDKTGSGDRAVAYKLISAVGRSDYGTVYKTVFDVVMSSGDISVFWQEIIDSYRDMMVVKNSSEAKAYLDLTEVEYETLREMSRDFSMPRMIYHTSVLEESMADMQRAVNSKRSIAEIALTKMCDPKMESTPDALLARVEELEKKLAMMQLGINTAPVEKANPEIKNNHPTEQKQEIVKEKPKQNLPSNPIPYDRWGTVVEKIGELKRSLASQFNGSVAYKNPDMSISVRMNPFFAALIKANASDFAILCGVIAELEGVNPKEIVVSISGNEQKAQNGPARDFENI